MCFKDVLFTFLLIFLGVFGFSWVESLLTLIYGKDILNDMFYHQLVELTSIFYTACIGMLYPYRSAEPNLVSDYLSNIVHPRNWSSTS